ncbi:hypothetical protein TNCV_1947081 [Trichonephila clavipes]|nr:hypothetical protein TNCV_1947081 [Trichonephila clavipes]
MVYETPINNAEHLVTHITGAVGHAWYFANVRSAMYRDMRGMQQGPGSSNTHFDDDRCIFHFLFSFVFCRTKDNKHVSFMCCLFCVLCGHYHARSAFPTLHWGCGNPAIEVSEHDRPSTTKDPPCRAERCTLNLSRAEKSSRRCGVVVRRGGPSSGVVHVT